MSSNRRFHPPIHPTTQVEAAVAATALVATAANAAIIEAAGLPERAVARRASAPPGARWTAAEDAMLSALIDEHGLVFTPGRHGGSNYDFLSMMLGRTAIAIRGRLFLRRMQFRGDTK